jgi:effector-binding domain-containing protein
VIAYQVVDNPTRPTAIVHAQIKSTQLPAFDSHALRRVLAAMEAQGTTPGGEPFAYNHGVADGTVDIEAGFPILGMFQPSGDVVPGELPGGRTVTGVHLGPYETLSRTYAEMSAWATANGMKPTGSMWEVYLTDPEREPDPTRWRSGVLSWSSDPRPAVDGWSTLRNLPRNASRPRSIGQDILDDV